MRSCAEPAKEAWRGIGCLSVVKLALRMLPELFGLAMKLHHTIYPSNEAVHRMWPREVVSSNNGIVMLQCPLPIIWKPHRLSQQELHVKTTRYKTSSVCSQNFVSNSELLIPVSNKTTQSQSFHVTKAAVDMLSAQSQ